jgi:hypothetical protein
MAALNDAHQHALHHNIYHFADCEESEKFLLLLLFNTTKVSETGALGLRPWSVYVPRSEYMYLQAVWTHSYTVHIHWCT